MSVIEDFTRDALTRQTDIAEQMVERMLVTPGGWGVVVHSWFDGATFHVQGELTKDVPAMTIAYHDGKPGDTPNI